MPPLKDRTGLRYGRLTVIGRADNIITGGRSRSAWKCKCDCGNECIITGDNLQNGSTKSCGCLNTETRSQLGKSHKIDISGQRFGKLTVINDTGKRIKKGEKGSSIVYKCKCDCGNTIEVEAGNLRSGNTLSCGCLGISKGEYLIERILLQNGIKYERDRAFDKSLFYRDSSHPLRFDFIVHRDDGTLSCLIEFDGEQHFYGHFGNWTHAESFDIIHARDALKDDYCFANKVPLIRIPYTVTEVKLEDLIPSMSQYLFTKERSREYYGFV